MRKLESRPSRERAWEYVFWIDLDGDVADPGMAAALDELAGVTTMRRVLGLVPGRARGLTPPGGGDANPSRGGWQRPASPEASGIDQPLPEVSTPMHPALHSTPVRAALLVGAARHLRHQQHPLDRRDTSPGRRPRHRGVHRRPDRRRRLSGRLARRHPRRARHGPPSDRRRRRRPADRSAPRRRSSSARSRSR